MYSRRRNLREPWIKFTLCFFLKNSPFPLFPVDCLIIPPPVIFLRVASISRSSREAQPRFTLISNLAVRDGRILGTYGVRFSRTGMTSVARRIRKRNVMPPKVSAADQWHEPIIISPRHPRELDPRLSWLCWHSRKFWNFDHANERYFLGLYGRGVIWY